MGADGIGGGGDGGNGAVAGGSGGDLVRDEGGRVGGRQVTR
jgi:hypothetical protein